MEGSSLPAIGSNVRVDEDVPLRLTPADLAISELTYQWSVKLFSLFRRLLRVDVNLHGSDEAVRGGEIFLFNHFSRFETFIPQYLIYQESGAYCRAVAASEFFHPGDPLTAYLRRVGAVPNDLDGLLPFLAAEVLRGRKLVIFPEGGMVKDRRVIDDDGQYRVYSRTAENRRKQHTGAAVLGLALDAFRFEVARAETGSEWRRIDEWSEQLELTTEGLLEACRRPTTIIPANITFYPIRVTENLLSKAADLLGEGLSPRATEELLIEGNILFRDTDMDIQLGKPILPSERWRAWERMLITSMSRSGHLRGLDDFFSFGRRGRIAPRVIAGRMQRKVAKLRDGYMHDMYRAVTVNLSHLASRFILMRIEDGVDEVDTSALYRVLYIAIKILQKEPAMHLHLHRSLLDPSLYQGLTHDRCEGVEQFLQAKTTMELLERTEHGYRFLPKLLEDHHFDDIRLENLIAVYANEVEPIVEVSHAIAAAHREVESFSGSSLAAALVDDALREYRWDQAAYSANEDEEVQRQETATEDGSPYLLTPLEPHHGIGVLLVHGFLASPAELRGLGDRLVEAGYFVFGVRLKGHGTSPWDLREQSYESWFDSVRAGFRIVAEMCDEVAVIGFSTGGALSLMLGAEHPVGLAGIAAVAVPLKFQNRAMVFVPLVHGANKLVRWASSWEGVMPFQVNESENPNINYRQIPIRGLYELRRLTDALKERLSEVETRVLIVQGDADPVVDPASAELLLAGLDSSQAEMIMVPADHHGIVYRDTGGIHRTLLGFLNDLNAG